MGEATDHGVTGNPLTPTLATPPVILHHPAGHLAAIREDSLAHHHEAEVIQAAHVAEAIQSRRGLTAFI